MARYIIENDLVGPKSSRPPREAIIEDWSGKAKAERVDVDVDLVTARKHIRTLSCAYPVPTKRSRRGTLTSTLMHDPVDPSRSGIALSWHCKVPHEGPQVNGEAHIRPREKKKKKKKDGPRRYTSTRQHAARSGVVVGDPCVKGRERPVQEQVVVPRRSVAGVPDGRTPAVDEDLDPLK